LAWSIARYFKAITSLPLDLPILVDTSVARAEERSLGNVTDVHVIGLSGQWSFAFSRSYPPFDIYGKRSTWKGLRATYDVSNISVQLLRYNLSNQSA